MSKANGGKISKQRAETIAKAIEMVYDSLQSHLLWTHKEGQENTEGMKFHRKCVEEYAEIIKLIASLY